MRNIPLILADAGITTREYWVERDDARDPRGLVMNISRVGPTTSFIPHVLHLFALTDEHGIITGYFSQLQSYYRGETYTRKPQRHEDEDSLLATVRDFLA